MSEPCERQATVGLEDLPELRKAFNKAWDEGRAQFEYKGTPLLTDYAKYLIEYLEIKQSQLRGRKE
jgi:hypothetical protein